MGEDNWEVSVQKMEADRWNTDSNSETEKGI